MPTKQKLIICSIIFVTIISIIFLALYTPYGIGAFILFFAGIYYLYMIYPKFDFFKDIDLNKNEKMIALTFDDGPTAGFTEEVLKILESKKVPATFFVLGKKAEQNKELIKKEIKAGHEIGVHTYDHNKLHLKNLNYIDSQISVTNEIIFSVYKELGENYKKLFRAPHGYKNLSLKIYLKQNQYKLIPWTRGAWDTSNPGSEWIVQKCTTNLAKNEIVLLHDGLGMASTVSNGQMTGLLQALPKIIDIYQSKGYRFVKVSEFLK